MGRGYRGKAMVISIDKATAVKMYDKVQKYWQQYLEGLQTKGRGNYYIIKKDKCFRKKFGIWRKPIWRWWSPNH